MTAYLFSICEPIINSRDYSVTAVLSNRCTQSMLKITYLGAG